MKYKILIMRLLIFIFIFNLLNISLLESSIPNRNGNSVSGEKGTGKEKIKTVSETEKTKFTGTKEGSIPDKRSDTVRVPVIVTDESEFGEIDSMEVFPAYDLYNDWDTIHIHSGNKLDWKNFSDSVIIFFDDAEDCGYNHPVQGIVNSDFGFRSRGFHFGIDLELKTGDTVTCAFDGMVRFAKRNKTYGNLVVVRHANGLETYYAHLSKIKVKVGQVIKAGELLGLGGSTGRSTGSHLHFEVRYKGMPINPNEIISFKESKLSCEQFKITKNCFQYLEKAVKYNGSGNGYYVIRKGDTLSAIARRHRTSVKRLCQLNGMKSTTTLRVGRRIRV